jgi:uncharacterized protein (TIGR02145 family)
MMKKHLTISQNHFFIIIYLFLLLFKVSCDLINPSDSKTYVPIVTTAAIRAITDSSAQCGGNITFDGGTTVTARGVCWSPDTIPTIDDNKTTNGTGTGNFTSEITGLTADTTYYVRAYATNSVGTGYGWTSLFVAKNYETGTLTDINGNVYRTVKIGNQWWMAENLRVTRYRNGNKIWNVTDQIRWSEMTMGAYCNYENDTSYVSTYGCLYNWYALVDSRNIAPEGWHVPTDDEWKELEMHLGMSQSEADNWSARGTHEGGKLKESGTIHWFIPNSGATNESGFTALPGGYRTSLYSVGFRYIGYRARFWTFTEEDNRSAVYRLLMYTNEYVYRETYDKQGGFSVRLVKD